ncbi:hypothetical protein [Photobacterium sp. TY1-4]|uniref:hypothetical protein n=1 Tax=Photobacterium sp. TY1-4 TaxID=2899122 RepID=UPI0021C20539|nr:hypothetical protein [Photobacterium sp. TY1-4]UXI03233.1 hypothetical protein NH461_22625 [Photobacterium sp. TY1-4]
MKKRNVFSLLLISGLLGGCQLTHVAGEVDGVKIRATTEQQESHDRDHHSHGSFCPPGQAKKGNC